MVEGSESLGIRHAVVDPAGRRLAYSDTGSGNPTVVLDGGLSHGMDTWELVLPGLAPLTRVVAYDRAGVGASDSAPTPRTSREVVDDLHALLGALAVPGPYVLVGFSFGGTNMRLYAHQFPHEVCAMVLVDALHPETLGRTLALLPPPGDGDSDTPAVADYRQDLFRGQLDPSKNREGIDRRASEAQVRDAQPLGDRPLVVLSRGKPAQRPADFPLPLAGRIEAVRWALQLDLARLSSHSLHLVATESDHLIPFSQPDLVIGAIRHVVEAVRAVWR